MASAPTNSTETTADNIIQDIKSNLAPLIQAAIIAQVPFLGDPVIKQITDTVENVIENYAAKMAEEVVNFAIVDKQVSDEKSAVTDALTGLEAAEKTGDSNAIANAEEIFENANASLDADDGSNQPS